MADHSTQLGPPSATDVVEGKFSLLLYARDQAAAAAPVALNAVYGVQGVTVNPVAYDTTIEVFHQGGGNERYVRKSGRKYEGSITILGGKVGEFITGVMGYTWGSTGKYGVIPEFEDYPVAHMAVVYRDTDNQTVLFTQILQDVALDSFSIGSTMEMNEVEIPFHSYHPPLILAGGAKMVYDVFTSNGSATSFTLSATPLSLVDTTWENADDFPFEKLVFVKVQPTGAVRGTRIVSGVQVTGTTLQFTAAPAAGKVQVLYAAALS